MRQSVNRLFSVALLLCCVVGTTVANVYVDFHADFSELARDVEFELQQQREFNGRLIREFNRELLLEFAIMVPHMRQVSNDLEMYIQNRDNIDEECREYTQFLFELYRSFQEYDIQDCASYAHYDLQSDSLNRFTPYERSYSRENFRSISQTMITLGRTNVLEEAGVVAELAEELDYYTTLRESYRTILQEELAKHGDDAYITINRFESCRDEAFYWQVSDSDYIREYLDENCYF